MQIIILAAGYGSRLKNEIENIPKSLIRLKEEPLLWWVLKFAHLFLPSEILIITGYKSQQIESYISSIKHLFKFPIQTIENPHFNKGNILSLKRVINRIDGDFLLLNTDHIYDKSIAHEILRKKEDCIIVCEFNSRIVKGDTKIRVINNKVVEISKKLKNFNGGYKGITLCHKNFLKTYKRAFIDTLKQMGEKACVEDILGCLVSSGSHLSLCNINRSPWLHINTMSDLEKAKRKIKQIDL